MTITDNDTATVSIAKTTDGNEAGPVNGVFTVTQTAASSTDTILSYTVGGTATSGSDYTALSGSVTIPAGATTATITVPIINDLIDDGTETVIVTLTAKTAGDADISIGAPNSATINLLDNDFTITPLPGFGGTMSPATAQVVEYGGSVTFTIIRTTVTICSFDVVHTRRHRAD